jgi:copper chaperone CopZ
MDRREYRVPGMTCDHCVGAVRSRVSAVAGVDDDTVRAALSHAGYEAA